MATVSLQPEREKMKHFVSLTTKYLVLASSILAALGIFLLLSISYSGHIDADARRIRVATIEQKKVYKIVWLLYMEDMKRMAGEKADLKPVLNEIGNFDRVLNGLLQGSRDMNIRPPGHPSQRVRLETLMKSWSNNVKPALFDSAKRLERGEAPLTIHPLDRIVQEYDAEIAGFLGVISDHHSMERGRLETARHAVIGAGLVVLIALAIIIRRRYVLPIVRLRDATREIDRGNFDIETGVESSDEIGELSLALTKMAGSLRSNINELTAERSRLADTLAELKQICDSAPTAMRVIDKDFNIILQNKEMSAMSGVSREEALGKKCYEVFKSPVCDTESCTLKQALRGEELVDMDVEKEAPDGRKVECWLQASPFRDAEGNVTGIICVLTDISVRKRAEAEMREKTENLERLHQVTVGRELAMLKLKGEVNTLLERLGEAKKYDEVERIKEEGI